MPGKTAAFSLEVGEGQEPSPAQIVEACNRYLRWCAGHRCFHPEKEFGKKRGGYDRQCRAWRNAIHQAYRDKPENKLKAAQKQAKYSTGTTAARHKVEDARARALRKKAQKPTNKPSLSRARNRLTRVRVYIKSKPAPDICAERLTVGLKWCGACYAFRPLDNFHACKTTPDKLQNRCSRNHRKLMLVTPIIS